MDWQVAGISQPVRINRAGKLGAGEKSSASFRSGQEVLAAFGLIDPGVR